jgi:hypothetical protein
MGRQIARGIIGGVLMLAAVLVAGAIYSAWLDAGLRADIERMERAQWADAASP